MAMWCVRGDEPSQTLLHRTRLSRVMVPLGTQLTEASERRRTRWPGKEAATRLELKIGRLAVNDDFDKNRYAGSARATNS